MELHTCNLGAEGAETDESLVLTDQTACQLAELHVQCESLFQNKKVDGS